MSTNVVHKVLHAADRRRLVRRGATVTSAQVTASAGTLAKSNIDKAKKRLLARRGLLTLS